MKHTQLPKLHTFNQAGEYLGQLPQAIDWAATAAGKSDAAGVYQAVPIKQATTTFADIGGTPTEQDLVTLVAGKPTIDVGGKARLAKEAADKEAVEKAEATAKREAADAIALPKAQRLALLAETDPIANRDNRQNAALTAAQMEALVKKGKAITAAQRRGLETYAQALRDMPDTVTAWPSVTPSDWPAKPIWLDAMVKKTAT